MNIKVLTTTLVVSLLVAISGAQSKSDQIKKSQEQKKQHAIAVHNGQIKLHNAEEARAKSARQKSEHALAVHNGQIKLHKAEEAREKSVKQKTEHALAVHNGQIKLHKAEEELAEFKRNVNANRAGTGERLVYP